MTRLESLLAEEVEKGSFPGGVALVGGAEEVTDLAAAGFAVREPEEVSVSADTLFDLASLTKPLVCGALVAAALPALDLKSSPGRYLPDWKATRYDGITLENELFTKVYETDDARTGVASFVEKGAGKAEFSGR